MNSDSVSIDSICFRNNDFNLYIFLIFCIIIFLSFIIKKSKDELNTQKNNSIHDKTANINLQLLDQIKLLQNELAKCNTLNQTPQTSQIPNQTIQSLNRIYNPLIAPERRYPLGRFDYSSNNDYQQIGFIFNDNDRYPLYGRPKYPGKTDKYEYYIIDETRNRLKIPYKSKNDNELYDGDNIYVDILKNNFSVKIYDYDNIKYNPTII